MTDILKQITAVGFREHIVSTTLDNLLMEGYPHINNVYEIFDNIDDETVKNELIWSLCNATEYLIHTYLATKSLVDADEWNAECSHHSCDITKEEFFCDVTVEYGVNGLKNIERANTFTAGFVLNIDDFLFNDSVVNSEIVRIAESIESQIMYDHTNGETIQADDIENIVTLYSLRDCTFITVKTNISDEQIKSEMIKFHEENSESDVADFSFEMSQNKKIKWFEISDISIDFENLED